MRMVAAADTGVLLERPVFAEGVSRTGESSLLDIVLFVFSFFGIHNVYMFS